MSDFEIAHKKTARNEGGYANSAADRGGETIYGIARNFWPKWAGWVTVDAIKKQYGKTAAIINKYAGSNPTLQAQVKEFYKVNFWYTLNLQFLNDQQLANNVYDFGVNAGIGSAGKSLQRAANAICGTLTIDGDVGSKTISTVNSLNAKLVYDNFNKQRKDYYDGIIERNPSQAVFRKSWYSRIVPYLA